MRKLALLLALAAWGACVAADGDGDTQLREAFGDYMDCTRAFGNLMSSGPDAASEIAQASIWSCRSQQKAMRQAVYARGGYRSLEEAMVIWDDEARVASLHAVITARGLRGRE